MENGICTGIVEVEGTDYFLKDSDTIQVSLKILAKMAIGLRVGSPSPFHG
jgi:hypothetical protein